jgi:ribosome modulation factor
MFRSRRPSGHIAPHKVPGTVEGIAAEAEGPRPMQFRDHPLLNTPNLTSLLLRSAAEGATSADAVLAELEALMARAKESPPVARDEIRSRLETLQGELSLAGLLAPAGPGQFGLTRRGRTALSEHPSGLSRADLMAYPEFAARVATQSRSQTSSDPHARAYDAGFDACLTGKAAAENPHPPDTADHQAWENGWSEALDRSRD